MLRRGSVSRDVFGRLAAAALGVSLAVGQARASADRYAQADPAPARPPVFCMEVYQPVCGRIDATFKTYSNACFARGDGATIVGDGPCGGQSGAQPNGAK